MKTIKNLFLLVFTIGMICMSCKKEVDQQPTSPGTPFEFKSLTADQTTLPPGGTTKITAVVTGDGLTYTWTMSSGKIIGSGSQITYINKCSVGGCTGGCPTGIHKHAIFCTCANAEGKQLDKSIEITVQ